MECASSKSHEKPVQVRPKADQEGEALAIGDRKRHIKVSGVTQSHYYYYSPLLLTHLTNL